MTFEQQFKKAFKNDLETILGGKFKLYTTNDITFKNYNKGDILAVIKTGQGTTSGVENVLATNIITTITFKCESIFLQEVLSILNEYVNNINGKYFETEDGIIFKLGLNTPYTIGSPTVENVGNESIYTSICQIVGNVFYSNLPIYRGYDVKIGKTYKGEIDFVAMKDGKKCFIQVAYLLSSDDVIEREFGAFDSVREPSPKYVFSLDEYDMSKDGITHFNIEEWLLNKVDVTLS